MTESAATLVTNTAAAGSPSHVHPPEPARSGGSFFSGLRKSAGFVLTVLLIWVGWAGRHSRNIDAGEGLGYWLGIIGGVLMLTLLTYSMRKRIPLLRRLGATRHWFRMHMTLGIVGPLIILYHSNFQVGSLNSQVALYCTLVVAASGIVGRYFYAQIHNGLYGSSLSLRQLVNTVSESGREIDSQAMLAPAVREQLAYLATTALQQPASLAGSALGPVRFGLQTRFLNWRMRRAAYRHIDGLAAESDVIRGQRTRLRRTTRRYIAKRLAEIRRVAQFRFFEQLFSLWHVVHVPFFLMMVFSAILHVIAVHMY